MAIETWHLETAIEKASADFEKLSDEDKNPLNIVLLARRYAPANSKHVIDALNESPALVFLEAKPGYLIIDVLISNIADVIASRVMQEWTKKMQMISADNAKKESMRNSLLGR